MSENLAKKLSGLPPHITLIAVLAAVVGAAGLALLLSRSEPGAGAQIVPRAARIERVDGNVGVARVLDNKNINQLEWDEATMNAPLSVGDRIYARNNARATLAFTGRNYARLNPGASLDVLSLTDGRTQLALRDGSAIFDVGHLEPGELFEVATPNGAIDFYEPGLYQIGMGDNGSTIISVLSGLAQVVGLAGSGQISKGEILTLAGQAAAQILLSKLAPDLAGNILDDYYGYRYPNLYDGRYRNYDRYLDDPHYYDPYRRSASYRYLSHEIPGLYDLDEYGQWRDVDGYGRCWSPRVSTGWAPYRNGYWDVNNVWGPTWVSQEPWGWAPYHYGRWAYANNRQWVWVPDQIMARPTYAPALVAFIPVERTNQIGWVPLAPGEPYAPRYYDSNFQPQYLGPDEVVRQVVNTQRAFVNMAVPTAVTVVPVPEFTEVIEPAEVAEVSPQLMAQSQPVLDPYVVESLRQVVMRDEKRRRKFRLPQELEHQIFNTPVVASEVPAVPAVRDDGVQALNVATVPEKQKKRKLKLDQNEQIVAEATQAAQGDKAARRELRELERQQRRQEKIERRAARQQAEAQQSAMVNQEQASQQELTKQARKERKAQKRLERQQQAEASEQQQEAATERQAELRKQMKRQARMECAQQEAAHQSQIEQQPREQRKAERRAAREQRAIEQDQQAAMAQAAEQAHMEQLRAQRKAEKRAERQQEQ